MNDDRDRAAFEALAQAGADDDEAVRALAARLKARCGAGDLKAMAALWLHAAVAAPEILPATFDSAAQGWLGEPVDGPPIRATAGLPPAPIPASLWAGYWSLIAEHGGLGATGVTARAAALDGLVSPEAVTRLGKACLAYPGIPAAVAQGYPRAFSAAALARCKPGALGAAFLALEPDLQVPPRGDAVPPLDVLGARMAQARPVWGLVAGYQPTALHDMALSAFQLAQFGHPHAARFLAVVLTRVAVEQPAGGPFLLQTILTAWTHGRRTPPLMGVRWEAHWDKPVEAVRASLGVTPYASPYPADLFEQAAA